MRCYIGVDLGSTTTKAVILEESGEVIGRGITNSRSNYDVACAVAKNEAYVDAHFNLIQRFLEVDARVAAETQGFLGMLERAFRLEQYLYQLQDLAETCIEEVRALTNREESKVLRKTLRLVFEGLNGEAPGLYEEGAKRKSDFFRDIAGSRFMALAEEYSKETGASFEKLLGVYDKSIIKVESKVEDISFHRWAKQALRRVMKNQTLNDNLREAFREALDRSEDNHLVETSRVGTGYGRARLPFPKRQIRSEILCHGLGAHATHSETRTVLDIGGQDTKAIQVGSDGLVESFQMNDRCAAGCGRYLGYIADEMNLGLHELGPLAMKSGRPVRINSTCTVFAGAELRDRLGLGEKREDILAGLHRAIMLRAMSLLARSGGIRDEFTFTGGVSKNEAAVRSLRGLVEENYGDIKINICDESIYTGALGAAIFAMRDAENQENGEDDE